MKKYITVAIFSLFFFSLFISPVLADSELSNLTQQKNRVETLKQRIVTLIDLAESKNRNDVVSILQELLFSAENILAKIEKNEKDYTMIEKELNIRTGYLYPEEFKTVKIKERKGDWNTLVMDKFEFEVDYHKEWNLYTDVGVSIAFEKIFESDSEKFKCDISIFCGGQVMGYNDTPAEMYFYGKLRSEDTLCRFDLSTHKYIDGGQVPGPHTLTECEKILNKMISSTRLIK